MASSTAAAPPVKIAPDFGRHLIGRDIGLEIRKRYFAGAPDSWPSGLDFTGVEQATESCIDEILGSLARDHGLAAVQGLRIEGASRAVGETVKYVLSILENPPNALDAESIRRLLAEPSKRRTPKSRRKK